MTALTRRADDGAVARTDEVRMTMLAPAVDVGETAEEYIIVANLPGLRREDIEITYANDKLQLVGRAQPRVGEDVSYTRNEFAVGEFRRTFDLERCHIDGERIAADYQLGVLTVRIPKAEEARPRRIEVK